MGKLHGLRLMLLAFAIVSGPLLVMIGCGSGAESGGSTQVPQSVQDEMKASDDYMKAQAAGKKK